MLDRLLGMGEAMRQVVRILTLVLAGVLFIHVLPVSAQENQKEKAWTGKLADATPINKGNLSSILEQHRKWLEIAGKEGKRANLAKADLTKANLSGEELTGAYLNEAILLNANLKKHRGQAYTLDK